MLGTPAPEEAVAVIAAVERFLADTAPAVAAAPPANPWQRASLLEGVGAKAIFASPWGEERTWGTRHARER